MERARDKGVRGVMTKLRRARNPRRARSQKANPPRIACAEEALNPTASSSATTLIAELKGFGVDSENFAMMNRVHVHDLRLNVMLRQATSPQAKCLGSPGSAPRLNAQLRRRSSLNPLEVSTEDTLPERLKVILKEIHSMRVQRGRESTGESRALASTDFIRLGAARKHRPQPLDLSSVALPQELQPLLLKCARHIHALSEGVPFDKLAQHERAASLNRAAQCLEVVRYVGFEIVPIGAAGPGAVPEYLEDTIEVASYQQHGKHTPSFVIRVDSRFTSTLCTA